VEVADSYFSDLLQGWLPEGLNAAGLGMEGFSEKGDGMSSRLLSVRGQWKVCPFSLECGVLADSQRK